MKFPRVFAIGAAVAYAAATVTVQAEQRVVPGKPAQQKVAPPCAGKPPYGWTPIDAKSWYKTKLQTADCTYKPYEKCSPDGWGVTCKPV